eukprot:SM013690S00010  [mRNA]  locus=s13690:48:329:- [translate_table: standard]
MEAIRRSRSAAERAGGARRKEAPPPRPPKLPLVVALNCMEDCEAEARELRQVAELRHVGLGELAKGALEAASVVILLSLAVLPRAVQQRLKASQ